MKKLLSLLALSLGLPSCLGVEHRVEIERRTKIAVIDTGFDFRKTSLRPYLCRTGHKSFVDDQPLRDDHGHGTNLVGLIARNLDSRRQCILVLKFFRGPIDSARAQEAELNSLRYAISQKVSFINLSLGGPDPISVERSLILQALKRGIKIAIAAGNEATDLDKKCSYFPACYQDKLNVKNLHIVGFPQFGCAPRVISNYGRIVRYHECGYLAGKPSMTGTSQSTAIHMGKWAGGRLP